MRKKPNRTRVLPIAGLIVVVGIGGYFVIGDWSGGGRSGVTPADILRRNGYLEIRPATNVGGPGTLITIDVKTSDYVMLHPTCNMDWQEIAQLWQTSPTQDTEIAHQLEGEFKLGAQALKEAGFDLSAEAVQALSIKFQNTKVIWLSDETRMDLGNRYLKDNCLKAVLQVTDKDKKCVTQPISAMQADVAYRVKFSDNVAADQKAKVLGGISGAVAGGGATTGSDSVAGKGLFVGLKLNGWCIVPNDGKQPGTSVAALPTATPAATPAR